MGEFGVSQPVRRREDPRLVTGRGRFVDDLVVEGCAYAWPLRSPHAHARIRGVDTAAARAAPGVLAVFTAAELEADGIGAIRCRTMPGVREGTRFVEKRQPLLARDVTRFAGECIAFVVAESLAVARDAAELVTVDYEPLPAVVEASRADREDAPLVWEDTPENLSFDFVAGDEAATTAAFASAAHVISTTLVNNRVVQAPLETRGALAVWEGESGRVVLHTGTQMPNRMKSQLLDDLFGSDGGGIEVRVGDVGGGFGGKNPIYPEQALTVYAARKLRRSVKWIGERSDAFVSDAHGRDNVSVAELALDADGRFLAVRVSTHSNLGAYTATGGTVSPTSVVMLPNAYRTPAVHVRVKGMFTNTVPTDAYRGAGRPEVTYVMERLVELAARELDLDPAELRRRNYIPPDAFPYTTPTGLTYDSADFVPAMEEAMRQAGWRGIRNRREEAHGRARLRGIGMSNYIERCGGGGGLSEAGRIRVDANGTATVYSGSMSNGQGHETAFSQIVNERLGLPFEKIRIIEGDTELVQSGLGTGGSWSVAMGGGAIALAADRIVEKTRHIAAHALEAAEADLTFDEGRFTVRGTDLSITIEEIARIAHDPSRLPPGMRPGLDEAERFQPENYTFPYGCHICEVEVDPDTGKVEIVAYTAVHDFGRALNPLLLEGQVHGGVTQGIGQALLEHTVYDDSGQLLSGSFMDYCLPRADDIPAFRFVPVETPTPRNPLGIKGCGEAGATGAPPAVVNAIVDALAPLGVRNIDMPATPERIWSAIQSVQGGSGS